MQSNDRLSLEQELAELVDEVVFTNSRLDEWAKCCEALLGYTVLLEQSVVLPSFGTVAKALEEFHVVADARSRGQAVTAPLVNSNDNPRLARLFETLQRPNDATLSDAERLELVSGPSPANVDGAYAALVGFTKQQGELMDFIARARNALGDAAAGDAPRQGAAPENSVDDLRRELEETRAQLVRARQQPSGDAAGTSDLRAQLALADERNNSQAQLSRQELELTAARLEAAQRQLRDGEREVDELRMKLRSSAQSEQLYQQAASERALLQERVAALEEQARQNEADRAAAAESYEALYQALEASGNAGALQHVSAANTQRAKVLETEVNRLRALLDEDAAKSASMQREHERTVKDLRRKLVVAQQQLQQLRLGIALNGPESRSLGLDDASPRQVLPNAIGDLINGDASEGRYGQPSPGRESSAPRAKLRAFELTVSALNAELAQVEDKIIDAERRAAEDRAALERSMAEERLRFKSEQDECDSVLATVSAELEQCMKENTELRARLQTQYRAASRN